MAEQHGGEGSDELVHKVRVERIEDTDLFKRLKLTTVEPSKAATARILALILIWTFAAVLLSSLGIAVYVLHRTPTLDDKSLTASTEFLKSSSTIFSPLLAFVLGYYFSKREE